MVNKDLRAVLKALEAAGYTVQRTKKNHVEVRRAGLRITTFSATPSDRRALMNALATLRRDGFIWPPRR